MGSRSLSSICWEENLNYILIISHCCLFSIHRKEFLKLRWAITLSAYDYEVQYIPSTQHGNADALSRLPLEHDDDGENEEEEIVCVIEEQQLDNLPLKGKTSQKQQNKIQSCLKSSIKHYMAGQTMQV